MNSHWQVHDRFYPRAKQLRSFFDQSFKDPRTLRSERFVWDYWYVHKQYCLLRTPAHNFFPEQLYLHFREHLVKWGQRVLGCHDVTAPWLSYYVEGCGQELHADSPHGPWAYVYSLTPWENRHFEGGETLILQPEVLQFWRNFDSSRGLEKDQLTHEIPALMNRLVVFDPRLPHGVNPVHGTRDPRKGRLVLHGWFLNPKPFALGSLRDGQIQAPLNRLTQDLAEEVSHFPPLQGTLSLRLHVTGDGRIRKTQILTQTLVSPQDFSFSKIWKIFSRHLKECRFPKTKGPTQITLPLLFS